MKDRLIDRYDFKNKVYYDVATDRQREVLNAVNKHQNLTHAADSLGITITALKKNLGFVVSKANVAGKQFNASDNVSVTASEGYQIGKVTTQRRPDYTCPKCGNVDPGKIERVWDRQFLEPAEVVAQAISDYSPKPLPKINPPKKQSNKDLLNLYTITDFHLGMYAWEAECGEAWDTEIAGSTFFSALSRMHEISPKAGTALLNIQGDFLHWDGLDAVTPTNKHLLDADTRFGRLIGLSMDMIGWAAEFLAKRYDNVHIVVAEGNHDLVSSSWLRHHIHRITKNIKHVTVDMNEFPYYAYLHGQTLIGIHHGHKKKNASLPALFSEEPRFREMWGKSKYTFIHTGHMHHESMQISENGGALVIRHPTLAPRDAHSARGGWNSQRGAYVFTYNNKGHEVCRNRVTPEAI